MDACRGQLLPAAATTTGPGRQRARALEPGTGLAGTHQDDGTTMRARSRDDVAADDQGGGGEHANLQQ